MISPPLATSREAPTDRAKNMWCKGAGINRVGVRRSAGALELGEGVQISWQERYNKGDWEEPDYMGGNLCVEGGKYNMLERSSTATLQLTSLNPF